MALTLAGAALDAADAEIAAAIEQEAGRQRDGLELIASENYPSEPVLAAMGSVLTNKYAEGYPGKRYYGGCEFVDVVEELAIERAKSLFGADHANVQAHSGTQANIAAYFALLSPGDTAMGLELNHGGHLTHGLPVNISGRWFEFVSYGVDRETELIDYDAMAKLAREHRPKVIVVGATAYPRVFDFARAAEIAESVDAVLMVDMAHIAGLVAGGVHPSPVPYAPVVTTTTHKTLRGPRSALILTNDEMARPIDRAIFPGTSGGPHMHTIAAKAVALKEAATPEFASYAAQIVSNAQALAEGLQANGWRVVSGGTDNHLLLLDVGVKGLTGKAAESALDAAGITVNKNTIPYDTRRPTVTSGIRIGTPALTTRGMREDEMSQVAGLISRVLDQIDDADEHRRVAADVRDLASSFPIPGIAN
ncbi:MAG: serine hydroxymethyltransferase [Chloroflexi bacterium]|nr:serine hydroxymethyltransferase [Chloroflexota bacterium]MYF80889.1 serine hydroxymethyltransferase [Chloroflexota bacterium]MYI04363.1 serine hydroxymethyltransferase [Chloroflexota bacterium]